MSPLCDRLTKVLADETKLNEICRKTNWNGPLQCDGFVRGYRSLRQVRAPIDQALLKVVEALELLKTDAREILDFEGASARETANSRAVVETLAELERVLK